ncbi:MAG: sensor histidine kinase [Rhodocyclales bacterium GT-UBC]|nr:MAG: sensor histidine kinase [Rhodocyclales bacterium GT-UBC]
MLRLEFDSFKQIPSQLKLLFFVGFGSLCMILVSILGQSCLKMNARFPIFMIGWLLPRPHVLLAFHLLILHLLAFGGWQIPAVRLLWLVALGLFLIWQPFVAGEQSINVRQGVALFFVAVATAVVLGPWLLLIWSGALAAVIGGRVIWTERRRERLGYLFAFGYLVAVSIFGVVPELSSAIVLDPLPRDLFACYMPLLLPCLFLFPAAPLRRRAGDAFDLFYGVQVFLVLAVFVLGALAYMLVGNVSYVESLIQTSLMLAGALLVVAWAWNPRAGFSGLGSAISRYLLSVGLPLEQWLVQLSEESEREPEPELFLAAVMRRLAVLSWVRGGTWKTTGEAVTFGIETSFQHHFQAQGVSLSLSFRHPPSPAMRWYIGLLMQLVTEFYLVKRQTYDLQKMGYLQAVYETGARVTHDVKNLLQSMQVLCYAAARPNDPVQTAALLGRQLPLITERLKTTLEKLQSPRGDSVDLVSEMDWWSAVRVRYAHISLIWEGGAANWRKIPGGLFDSVAENLLQNALAKRQRYPDLEIRVGLQEGRLWVADNGAKIETALAFILLREPVPSEDGLGIGLYHAARQAEGVGYRLRLTENQDGRVVFELSETA